MVDAAASPRTSASRAESSGAKPPPLPTVSLPKGGGAIRGMGEKFAANPVTGTGSMSVPIPTSPGRSGFGPQLSLSYDSGSGNGTFGFGWSLSLPSITRKTDKGMPQYRDADESDDFVLSGAEDLVPLLMETAQGSWERENLPVRTVAGATYRVRRYRPRIEGLFARIEHWINTLDASDDFWRSISRDNVTTWYGKTAESRVADPADERRIFSWLICQSNDDKGNAIAYGYRAEDSARILEDAAGSPTPRAHERNRTVLSRSGQRYLKRVRYGNRTPYLPTLDENAAWPEPVDAHAVDGSNAWLFELVLDYGEHDAAPTPNDAGVWPVRPDPFSTYRAGFEVRTYRTCQRALMFHHFPDEPAVAADCLVRSLDLTYSDEVDPSDVRNPVYTFLRSVTLTGYRRNGAGFDRRSLPPVDFEYSEPVVQDEIEYVDPRYLANLPVGLDGSAYRWVDLHGVGLPGVLTEQAGAWFFSENLSPATLPHDPTATKARFGALSTVALTPHVSLSGGAEVMDLAGDGRPDVVVMRGRLPGLYEHDDAEGWGEFRPFTSRLDRDLDDPSVRLVDLDGDGHADVLITEDDAFVWHPSLAEAGFGRARRVTHGRDEEKHPCVVFADGTQSIHLADLSGDGLTDLVRIRNGEVCYWPNLGYGRFGAKVAMDNAPWLDEPDQFSHDRIRLSDIDGSGTTDLIYLHRDGVRLYFNQSGNGWSRPHVMKAFPRVDDSTSIMLVDLLGNSTACLVWSSQLPDGMRRQLRYVNLMGNRKPHLLVRSVNNLGAETTVEYASSTTFYLRDKLDQKPWMTRLPYPVHVVERVVSHDHVSRNRFATRYSYHHGYFDGEEREFRGFGLVEQWDTETFAAFRDGNFPADNLDAKSHVPPVHTKTWFHTGGHAASGAVARTFEGEYFREPGLTEAEARDQLLPDTVLSPGLTTEERREACRALKGSMLRQEIYADDAGSEADEGRVARATTPYSVTEQSFAVRVLQPRGDNHHAVFLMHPSETLAYAYERNAADPRVAHELTLEVDDAGDVLKRANIGYGRRTQVRVADAQGDLRLVLNPALAELHASDRERQTTALLTYTETAVTNAVDADDTHRMPLSCETTTFELTGFPATAPAGRHDRADLVEDDPNLRGRVRLRCTAPDVGYESVAVGERRRRLIERLRTLYRRDDLAGFLPLGELESRALPGETYQLALTAGFMELVFQRPRPGQPPEPLLPDPMAVLAEEAGHRGGYLQSSVAKADSRFPASDPDDHWFIPSGRLFLSPDASDDAASELAEARQHFYLSRRSRDPFGHDASADYDGHDLLLAETRDALGNRTTVDAHDYRVLQPRLVSDPNRNRSEVTFDVLGMVAGTAVMGKPLQAPVEGDSLTGFVTDLPPGQIDALLDSQNPQPLAAALLVDATTRVVYDLDRFRRTKETDPDDPTTWQPACTVTLARETHASAPAPPQGRRIQLTFSYSDGFGREVQRKTRAEPGPLDLSDSQSPNVDPRWIGSGWVVYNNKGDPVRQYEPFFSATHHYEFGATIGVSPVLFYDPVGRVVATLSANHTYEKVVFDAWHQTTYDVNDTCAARGHETGDPRLDPDVGGFVAAYFEGQPDTWQTWHAERVGGDLGEDERSAAERAEAHADTPTTEHVDVLGRTFLTVQRNRVAAAGHDHDGAEDSLATRLELDIGGNQRVVRDPVVQAGDELGRVVMRYAYDLVGNEVYRASLEAGARWLLNNVSGEPIRTWDSRGHNVSTTYDALGRPLERFVRGTSEDSDPRTLDRDVLVERIEYGEPGDAATDVEQAAAQRLNLRTRVLRHFDSAGIITMTRLGAGGDPAEAYDFKGNLLCSTRQLASEYKTIPDWSQDPAVDAEVFEGRTRYDALNRPVQSIPLCSSLARAKPSVIQPTFDVTGLLDRVDVWLGRSDEPAGLIDPQAEEPALVGVSHVTYDAKGQRQRIEYKNGVITQYAYDPRTFRVTSLVTRRNAAEHPDDDPDPLTAVWPGRHLQNLHYTYDPAGNITHIRDDAQQAIFFRNKRVEPGNDYTYDALYRLVRATGREHLGQGAAPLPHTHDDAGRTGILSVTAGQFGPNDGSAMATYTERYVYDAVGNVAQMQHRGLDPAHPGWTRSYDYLEASPLEDGSDGAAAKTSNRLTSTSVDRPGAGAALVGGYEHDPHGNMVRMPHLGDGVAGPNLDWDHADRLRRSDLGGGGTAHYVYDSSGQRVRKVWEKAPGLVEERLYLGSVEVFRRHGGAIDNDSAVLERESLHAMDDHQQRIALVETRTLDVAGDDPAPARLVRYQLSNHLGSASLEVDDTARIISFEEHAPYGSTTYQAVRSQAETTKRYRHTGKERDDETGLSYHGARYYAVWLGRWTSPDPIGLVGDVNLYVYCAANPLNRTDAQGTDSEWCVFCNPFSDDVEFAPIEAVTAVASDAAEGSRIITEGISRGTTAAGDWVMDQAIDAAETLDEGGHPWLAAATRGAGVFAAGTTKTVGEVGGQLVAAGPNAILALERGGTLIGTGAARYHLADNWQDKTLGALEILAGAGEGAQVGLQAVGMSRSWGSGTIKKAGPSSTVQENKIHGDMFRDKVVDARTTPWREARNEVTIRPNVGPGKPGKASDNFRIDSLERSKITGKHKLVEAKGTKTADLSNQQKAGFRNFERYGGEVRGKAGGTLAPHGAQLPPSAVEMYRPIKLFLQIILPPATLNATRRE